MSKLKNDSLFIFKFNCIPLEKPALWKTRAFARIYENFNRNRLIYIPVWDKRTLLCAMTENANVYTYRNSPYVELDWCINYYETIREKELAKILRKKKIQWLKLLERRGFVL